MDPSLRKLLLVLLVQCTFFTSQVLGATLTPPTQDSGGDDPPLDPQISLNEFYSNLLANNSDLNYWKLQDSDDSAGPYKYGSKFMDDLVNDPSNKDLKDRMDVLQKLFPTSAPGNAGWPSYGAEGSVGLDQNIGSTGFGSGSEARGPGQSGWDSYQELMRQEKEARESEKQRQLEYEKQEREQDSKNTTYMRARGKNSAIAYLVLVAFCLCVVAAVCICSKNVKRRRAGHVYGPAPSGLGPTTHTQTRVVAAPYAPAGAYVTPFSPQQGSPYPQQSYGVVTSRSPNYGPAHGPSTFNSPSAPVVASPPEEATPDDDVPPPYNPEWCKNSRIPGPK